MWWKDGLRENPGEATDGPPHPLFFPSDPRKRRGMAATDQEGTARKLVTRKCGEPPSKARNTVTGRKDGHPFHPTTPMNHHLPQPPQRLNANDPCHTMPIPSSLRRAQSMLDLLHDDLSELDGRLQPVAPSAETIPIPDSGIVKESGPTCEVDAKIHDIIIGITQAKRRISEILGRLKL